MRLLVLSFSPPESAVSWSFKNINAPQPPGPGLPRQLPSVYMSIFLCMGNFCCEQDLLWESLLFVLSWCNGEGCGS